MNATDFLLILFNAAMIGAWLWLLARVNAQIRRYRDDPTPRKRFDQLREDVDAQDDRIKRNRRDTQDNSLKIEDAFERIRSLQNKYAAQKRNDDKVDLLEAVKLSLPALASQQDEGSDQTEAGGDSLPPGLDSRGEPFDFR